MSDLEHGTPIESWTIHAHSIWLVCPKCRMPVFEPYRSFYTISAHHVFSCACGQSFGLKWLDQTQDAVVTIHTWEDL